MTDPDPDPDTGRDPGRARRAVRKGEPWGRAAPAAVDRVVDGDDATLARYVAEAAEGTEGSAPLVDLRPTAGSDLARALGATRHGVRTTELAVDVLAVDAKSDGGAAGALTAVNAVVVGTAPDRTRRASRRRDLTVTVDGRPAWSGPATGVVVANGQFLRGADIAPRGHPGDGRVEVQVYSLAPGERAGMRARLALGTHVPHPRILERSGRVVEVACTGPAARLEVDGVDRGRVGRVTVRVLPAALRVVV